jgi:hypothetical protein
MGGRVKQGAKMKATDFAIKKIEKNQRDNVVIEFYAKSPWCFLTKDELIEMAKMAGATKEDFE